MRLLLYNSGHWTRICHEGAGLVQAEHLESRLRKHVHPDGSISALTVDFAGTQIPLVHESEIRLVASMLAAQHNQHINVNAQVQTI